MGIYSIFIGKYDTCFITLNFTLMIFTFTFQLLYKEILLRKSTRKWKKWYESSRVQQSGYQPKKNSEKQLFSHNLNSMNSSLNTSEEWAQVDSIPTRTELTIGRHCAVLWENTKLFSSRGKVVHYETTLLRGKIETAFLCFCWYPTQFFVIVYRNTTLRVFPTI